MSDSTTATTEEKPRPDAERLDELFAPFNRADAPGLVVAVARQGHVIYRRAFGLASVQHAVANTTATRMRIGSTTKHFTCLAALLLHERGKLDVDEPVTTRMPEFKSPGPVPTWRQFMSHTSGMRCSLDLSMMGNGMALQPKGWQPRRLFEQQHVNFEPMHGQMYCNGGYHLLSMAIDRAAGVPFENFLRSEVLLPLGMTDTECMPSDFVMLPRVASCHLPTAEGGWRLGQFPTEEIRGEGSLVSTLDDMLRWLAHLNGNSRRVGSEATWQQMLTPPVLANGLQSVYGLGLYHHAYRGVAVIHHAGGVIGGNSQMLTVPAHGLDVVIMVNGALCNAAETGFKIVDLLLEDKLQAAPQLLPLQGFEHLVGQRYHGRSGTLISFGKVKDDRLGLGLNLMPPMPILRQHGETAAAGFEDVALGPLRFMTRALAATPEGVAPDVLTWRDSGNEEQLVRVDSESTDLPGRGQALVGRYRSADLAAEAALHFEGDQLIMVLRGDYGPARRLKVEAFSDTAFAAGELEMPGAGYALTAERTDDGVRRFRLDGIRARHVAFDRVE